MPILRHSQKQSLKEHHLKLNHDDHNRCPPRLQYREPSCSQNTPTPTIRPSRCTPPISSPSLQKSRVDNTNTFNPENNPEVMTALVQKLGLSDSLSFHDIYSLDDPSLLAFVPRPVQALLLVFPTSKGYEAGRMAEDAPLAVYNGCGPEEEVLWFRQTIGNACGMMGLLHLACNGGARELIGKTSFLRVETTRRGNLTFENPSRPQHSPCRPNRFCDPASSHPSRPTD